MDSKLIALTIVLLALLGVSFAENMNIFSDQPNPGHNMEDLRGNRIYTSYNGADPWFWIMSPINYGKEYIGGGNPSAGYPYSDEPDNIIGIDGSRKYLHLGAREHTNSYNPELTDLQNEGYITSINQTPDGSVFISGDLALLDGLKAPNYDNGTNLNNGYVWVNDDKGLKVDNNTLLEGALCLGSQTDYDNPTNCITDWSEVSAQGGIPTLDQVMQQGSTAAAVSTPIIITGSESFQINMGHDSETPWDSTFFQLTNEGDAVILASKEEVDSQGSLIVGNTSAQLSVTNKDSQLLAGVYAVVPSEHLDKPTVKLLSQDKVIIRTGDGGLCLNEGPVEDSTKCISDWSDISGGTSSGGSDLEAVLNAGSDASAYKEDVSIGDLTFSSSGAGTSAETSYIESDYDKITIKNKAKIGSSSKELTFNFSESGDISLTTDSQFTSNIKLDPKANGKVIIGSGDELCLGNVGSCVEYWGLLNVIEAKRGTTINGIIHGKFTEPNRNWKGGSSIQVAVTPTDQSTSSINTLDWPDVDTIELSGSNFDYVVIECPTNYEVMSGGAVCKLGESLTASFPKSLTEWQVSCGNELADIFEVYVTCILVS